MGRDEMRTVLGKADAIPESEPGEVGRFVKEESESDTLSDLATNDKNFLWHPFTQMREWMDDDPLIIDRAEGVYLYDTQGRRYLDAVSSLWANVHGHGHPVIDQAIRDQLDKAAHTTLLGLSNPPAIELAQQLIGIAPTGLSRIFYTGDGASAVEAALKMSYQFWTQKGGRFAAKKRFMSFVNGYHGDTLGAVSVGGIDLFHGKYRDLLNPSIRLPYAYCYRCHLNLSYPECSLLCADNLESHFQRHHCEVAALIVEPKVQGAGGMIVAPDGFLRRLRDLCTRYEVHLIADEVATGFGRTGAMFACEWDGVTPDLLCLGKGITGGYLALAATLATEEVFEAFLGEHTDKKTFFHGHTYAGNPLACAAGLGSLEVFRRERVLDALPKKIEILAEGLSKLKGLPNVGDIRQAGFMVGVELLSDCDTKAPFPESARVGARVAKEMRKRGVFMRPLGDVLVLVLPLSIGEDDIRTAVNTMRDSIEEVVDH